MYNYNEVSTVQTVCQQYYNAEVMLKLCLTVVRPHLDYAVQVWHPYQAKNITVLENNYIEICHKNLLKNL